MTSRAERMLQQQMHRVQSIVERSRIGRSILGINVVVTLFMASTVSAGVLVLALLERQLFSGVIAAGVTFAGSLITNAVESYRTSRQSSARQLNGLMKAAYRDALERSRLWKE